MTKTIRLNKNRKLKVGKNHFYNQGCSCMDCLSLWLMVSSGELIVKSFDGKHKMVFPLSKNGTVLPPK